MIHNLGLFKKISPFDMKIRRKQIDVKIVWFSSMQLKVNFVEIPIHFKD